VGGSTGETVQHFGLVKLSLALHPPLHIRGKDALPRDGLFPLKQARAEIEGRRKRYRKPPPFE